MKNRYLIVILCIVLIGSAWWFFSSRSSKATVIKVEPFNLNFPQMRIENEGKLAVPRDKVEEVWDYLQNRLVNDKTFIQSLDPSFDSYWYDEIFTDIYYDTPDLIMLDHQSGIRNRTRVNLTNPEAEKSGRRLLQIKLSGVDKANEMSRGEIKFDINEKLKLNDSDDLHPILGLLKPSDRPEFKEVMSQLGIDPYSLKQILIIEQRRRSIYITRNGEQFISLRLDDDSSKLLGVEWKNIEIEPELNEIPYTSSDAEGKAYMEGINTKIIEDILNKFPYIHMDLTPKYNKAFAFFETKIPLFRFLVNYNLIQ
jgi:hypothetical protein